MGKIVGKSYILSDDELDALAEKNSKAINRPELLERARIIQERIRKAHRLCKEADKALPRYYDYRANGQLKRR